MRHIAIISLLFFTLNSYASSQPYIGEVQLYANNFCPRYWMEAKGQKMKKDNYQALFSLLGYQYGGSGDYFHLPDLQDIAPENMKYCIAIQGMYPARN